MHWILKRGPKKPPQPEVVEPPAAAGPPPNVKVNHASRQPAAPPPTQTQTLTVPQNPGVVEVLPLLKDVPLTDRHALFIRKVQTCCVFFDFSDPMKSAREKEIKRQALSELVDLVQSGSCKMNEIMQEEMVKMLSLNIFRCLPPAPHEITGSTGGDPEEEELFTDPTWPHLQLAYELLLRYVVSSDMETKIAKKYLDHTFLLKMLDVFDSEDMREREYLKTILHRIYGRFMVHRPFIRNAINNILYRFVFEDERYCGVGELLEILASIINGFALPIREEHKLFLVRALIPMHTPKCMATYHPLLTYCVTQFVEKDYRLADVVIRGLLKCWPVTNCGKEVLFLGEMEEILEYAQSVEFQKCMIPLFRRIGQCLNSPHFQVAERALFWWNNEHIVGLITENRRAILPIIFDALENNIQNHWNPAINGLTSNVRRMFQEMDPEHFEECQRQHDERLAKEGELVAQRASTWNRLEQVANKGVEVQKRKKKTKTAHKRA